MTIAYSDVSLGKLDKEAQNINDYTNLTNPLLYIDIATEPVMQF